VSVDDEHSLKAGEGCVAIPTPRADFLDLCANHPVGGLIVVDYGVSFSVGHGTSIS